MSGGDVMKEKLHKFFTDMFKPRPRPRKSDVQPSFTETKTAAKKDVQEVKPTRPAVSEPELDSGKSVDKMADIFHSGGDFEDDYIEDDYCLDYSSSDAETYSQNSMNSQASQKVRMGVSALRKPTARNLGKEYCPLGQKVVKRCQEQDDQFFEYDSFSDIFPKDEEYTMFESVSGHTNNALEYMSVSAFDQKDPEDSILKTPEGKAPNFTPSRPTKENREVVMEDIGVYFHLGEPIDEKDLETPRKADSGSESVQKPLYRKTPDSVVRVRKFSQLVKCSPGFPVSPQKHIYRPSARSGRRSGRRDSGYMSKSGSPTGSPEERAASRLQFEEEEFHEKLRQMTKQKTLVLTNRFFNLPTIGPAAGPNRDLIDGIETEKKVKVTAEVNQLSQLKPLVEINEISPMRRTKSTTALNTSNSSTQSSDKSRARRSIQLDDVALDLSMKATDGDKTTSDIDVCTTPKTKPKLPDPKPVSSTPVCNKEPEQSVRTGSVEMAEGLSPVKVVHFKLAKPSRRGAKRELKKILSTEASSAETRPGKKYRKKRSKVEKDNFKPSKGIGRRVGPQSPVVSDYLILKKMAEDIVKSIPGCLQLWQYFNFEKLMDYLYEFFHTEIKLIDSNYVRTISNLKEYKAKLAYDESATIESGKVLSALLYALLLNDQIRVRDVCEYAFKNLKCVVKDCPDLLRTAPEVLTMLLGNEDSLMVNSQGFPLCYNDSELEVMKVVKKYIEARKNSDREVDRRVKRVLLSVTDKSALSAKSSPVSPVLRRDLGLQYSSLQISDASSEERSPYVKLTNRPYHEIRFETSSPCVTSATSRQEYLRQSLLGPDPCQRSPDSREASKPAGSQDSLSVCSSSHLLRKISVCYRVEDGLTKITGIEMQYSSEERKRRKLLCLGEMANISRRESSLGTDTSDSSRRSSEVSTTSLQSYCSGKDDMDTDTRVKGLDGEDLNSRPLKSRAFSLRKGEHVTGVSVQGDAALQNLELSTNMGRRHCMLPANSSPWQTISLPLGGSPHCLQALYVDVGNSTGHAHSEQTDHAQTDLSNTGPAHIRSIGAVWAVMSRPLNNLNI